MELRKKINFSSSYLHLFSLFVANCKFCVSITGMDTVQNPKEYITCMCLVSGCFIMYVCGMYIKDNSYNVNTRYICLIIKHIIFFIFSFLLYKMFVLDVFVLIHW